MPKGLNQKRSPFTPSASSETFRHIILLSAGLQSPPPQFCRPPVMKRKKWSEVEEQTLLSKYSDLVGSGALSKLKTREKKFKPIAEHVNSLHHNQDPVAFPFKWTWRDVSIKVQNMRHQYLGVKQKIRVSDNQFNWNDGEIHWENFLKYKEVFGDIELPDCGKDGINGQGQTNPKTFEEKGICDILGVGLGYGIDGEEMEEDEDEDEEGEEYDEEDNDVDVGDEDEEGADLRNEEKFVQIGGNEKLGQIGGNKLSKGSLKGKKWRFLGAKVLELRELMVSREAKRREREWNKEANAAEHESARKDKELQLQKHLQEREERAHKKDHELEEMQISWMKREIQKRRRLERDLDEERRRRMKLEERWEEEEMEWRERMIEMQMEHEKQMMQMHADACQNQLQVLGAVARLVCQFFGSGPDGLGGGVGALPPQDLQNLQHPGGLGDGDQKPDASLPSEFL